MKYEETADLNVLVDFILNSVVANEEEEKLIEDIRNRVLAVGEWTYELKQELRKYIESVVPEGDHCYSFDPDSKDDKNQIPRTIACPFWDKNDSKHYQEAGYCHLLQRGDWNLNESKVYVNCRTGEKQTANEIGLPLGLLWDQCKECDVNPHRGFED